MFVCVELDPESGTLNNPGSVATRPTLKKAIKYMRKHLSTVLEDRETLSGLDALIIDTDIGKIVVELIVGTNTADLEAAVTDGHDGVPYNYFSGIKQRPGTNSGLGIETFEHYRWKR